MVQWNGIEYECYVGDKKFNLTEEELYELLEDNGVVDAHKAEIEELKSNIELLEKEVSDLESEIDFLTMQINTLT